MAKHRIRKYSRRRSASTNKRSIAPVVIAVTAFILLSFIVSVGVGIALGNRADKIADSPKFDFERVDYDSNGKTVSTVEAYHFPKGASPYDYVNQKIYDLSVCVSHKDGTLDYKLDAVSDFPLRENGEYSFAYLCENAKDAGARICAYVYITAFDTEDEYEREIIKAFEIALVNEIAASGADDILLLGLEPDVGSIDEIENFIAKAALASGETPLGVAVSDEALSLMSEGVYIAARMRSACDYLALDLRELTVSDGESIGKDEDGNPNPSRLESLLEKNKYYIKSYPMRIIFSQENFRIYHSALSLGVTDLQIVGE